MSSITVYDLGYSSRTLQAVFTPDIAIPETWLLTIIESAGGSTDITGVYSEDVGVTVDVEATANDDYTFTGWLLDGSDGGTDNPVTVADGGLTSRTLQPLFTYVTPVPTSVVGLIIPAYADEAVADYSRANVYWPIFDNELLLKMLNTTMPTFQEILERLKTRY